MIRIQENGGERELTFEEFVRETQAGRIAASTMVWSDVLTSGVWKSAGELQFFRSWAPVGSVPPRIERHGTPEPPPEPHPEPCASPPIDPEASIPHESREDRWVREREVAEGDEVATRAPDLRAAAPEEKRLPLEELDRHGFLRALYETIRLAFDDGAEYARRIGAGKTILPALVFGLIVTGITAIFYGAYSVGLMHLMKGTFEQMQSMLPEGYARSSPPRLRDGLFFAGMSILLYPAAAIIWAGTVHVILKIMRRAERPFAATFRVTSYAIAPMILNILPVCGVLIGSIWMIVLTIRGLATVHRSGMAAAVAAVLLPVLAWLILLLFANQEMLRAIPHLGGPA